MMSYCLCPIVSHARIFTHDATLRDDMAHEISDDDEPSKKELDMENGQPVDANKCDHQRTITATDHDEAPTGAEICRDCGTRVDT